MLRAQPVHLGCLVDPGRPPLPGFGSPGPAGWPVGHDGVSGDQAYVTSPDEVPVSLVAVERVQVADLTKDD